MGRWEDPKKRTRIYRMQNNKLDALSGKNLTARIIGGKRILFGTMRSENGYLHH